MAPSRIVSLINMHVKEVEANRYSLNNSPIFTELCDFLRRGKGYEVLEALKEPFKHGQGNSQEAAIEIINQCLLSCGPDIAAVLSSAKWQERLFRVAKVTDNQCLRISIMSKLIQWRFMYNTKGFETCCRRFRESKVIGDQYYDLYQLKYAEFKSTRPGSEKQSDTSTNDGRVVPTSLLTQHRGLSNIDTLILDAQGDIAALEYGLEHPEMLEEMSSTVDDCKAHLKRVSALLRTQHGMSDDHHKAIINLMEQLTTIIDLHKAIFGEGLSSDDEKIASTVIPSSEPNRTTTTAAIQAEKAAISQLIDAERKEADDLRAQLDKMRKSYETVQSKYKDSKEKNKKLIAIVEEYGTQLNQFENEKENPSAAPQVTHKETKVNPEVIKKIRHNIHQCRDGLRRIKEHDLRELGKEMRSQSVEIQAMILKIVSSTENERSEDKKALAGLQVLYKKEVALRKKYYNTIQDIKGNIRVYCRIRPMSNTEINNGHNNIINCISSEELQITDTHGIKTFEFDSVFGPKSTQEEVFEDTAPLIDSVVDGYNVCIFAYGQTGTGKTFTMGGSSEGDDRGINTRALDRLFDIIKNRQDQEKSQVFVSVLEVYCEQIIDLLTPKSTASKTDYVVKTGGKYGNYVTNMKEVEVDTPAKIEEVLSMAQKNRTEGKTDMNAHSSRSHMLLYILIKTTNLHTGTQSYGKLSLVDLAGSERLDKSGAEGQRAKEAITINKSLSALGDVISGLCTGSKHIPFRNSQLTYLLQDSMQGQAKVLMFCCVSPASYNTSESISSLNFASRARGVCLGSAKKNVL